MQAHAEQFPFICFFSAEDSEPIYDQPHLHQCHSDSEMEMDRASSADSPPPPGVLADSGHYSNMTDDVYSEIPRDTEQLLKPSQLKSKRAMYAG